MSAPGGRSHWGLGVAAQQVADRTLALAVDAVATYRVTRLVTADVLTQPLRERWIKWAYNRTDAPELADIERVPTFWQDRVEFDDDPPKLAVLVTCRWCAGVWVAGGVLLARNIAPRWWGRAAAGLTMAAAAALLAGLEHD